MIEICHMSIKTPTSWLINLYIAMPESGTMEWAPKQAVWPWLWVMGYKLVLRCRLWKDVPSKGVIAVGRNKQTNVWILSYAFSRNGKRQWWGGILLASSYRWQDIRGREFRIDPCLQPLTRIQKCGSMGRTSQWRVEEQDRGDMRHPCIWPIHAKEKAVER